MYPARLPRRLWSRCSTSCWPHNGVWPERPGLGDFNRAVRSPDTPLPNEPYGFREGAALLFEDAGCERVGGVARQDGASTLENRDAMVIDIIYQMHRAAAFGSSRSKHCFVDGHSVHALPAKVREQGWVDIDDAVDQPRRYRQEAKESAQADEFGRVCLKTVQHPGVHLLIARWLLDREPAVTAPRGSWRAGTRSEHNVDPRREPTSLNLVEQIENGPSAAARQTCQRERSPHAWSLCDSIEGGDENGMGVPLALTLTMLRFASVTLIVFPLPNRSAKTLTAIETLVRPSRHVLV